MGSQRGSSGVSSRQKKDAAGAFGGDAGLREKTSPGQSGGSTADGSGAEGGLGGGISPFIAATVIGRVQDPETNAVSGTDLEMDGHRTAMSDEVGAFSFADVAPGEHSLSTSHTDYRTHTITFSVDPGQIIRLEVTLQRP